MNAEEERRHAALPALPPWLVHAAGPFLVVALVLVLAGLAIASNQQRSHERGVIATQNLARLVEAQLSDNFDKIDLYLQLLALRYRDSLAGGAAGQVDPPLDKVPLIDLDSVKIADPSGRVRLRVGAPDRPALLPGEHVGEDAFFRRAVGDAKAGLVIAGPVHAGPGAPALMVFARAMRGTRGELLGVVFAAMGVAQFDSLFTGIQIGPFGMASLRTQDLRLVHRYPAWPGGGATTTPVSAELRQAVGKAPDEGVFTARSPLDGHERITVYRKLREHPFYVLVGLSAAELMAGWMANSMLLALLALLAVALTFWAALTHLRWSQRQLEALHNRFEAIVETSSDSIVSKTLQGRITTWNHGAQQMFGYTTAEIVGRPATLLAQPDRRGEEALLAGRVLRGERVQAFETVRVRKDGVTLDVSMSVSPILDTRGRIVGISTIARDISRRKALEAEIRAMAFNDALTQLPNRRLLMDRLRQAQLASGRQRSYLGVLFIDLDGFKQVNDNFGHEIGDQLLIEVGRRLQGAVRQHDTVARLGGDEFVVLLEELGEYEKTAADHVNTVADKILDAIERPYQLRGTPHRCSASIGIRLLVGSQDSLEQVLMDADAAMYHVKRQRRALKSLAFE